MTENSNNSKLGIKIPPLPDGYDVKSEFARLQKQANLTTRVTIAKTLSSYKGLGGVTVSKLNNGMELYTTDNCFVLNVPKEGIRKPALDGFSKEEYDRMFKDSDNAPFTAADVRKFIETSDGLLQDFEKKLRPDGSVAVVVGRGPLFGITGIARDVGSAMGSDIPVVMIGSTPPLPLLPQRPEPVKETQKPFFVEPYPGLECRDSPSKNVMKCKVCKKDMIPELAYKSIYCGSHCYQKGSKR